MFSNLQNSHRGIPMNIKEVRNPYVVMMVIGEKIVAVVWMKVRPGK
jgi:hypothetical protein